MTLVEGTNDYSIVSKLSAASAGYFQDDFLDQFVERKRKRASLINWGYYLRFKSLECSFEQLIKELSEKDEQFQILSVGAGFDTTFFNVATKYGAKDNFKFYEIDLPSNVARKTKLIEKSGKCRQLLKNPQFSESGIISETFKLFACDLANQDELQKKLENVKFDFIKPTVILSECVITYMEERDSTNLIKFLATHLHHAAFFVYEQIRPSDAFGKFMVAHFQKIGSPIKGIHKYFNCREHELRYLDCGWETCSSITLADVFNNLDDDEKQRIRDIELFDEYEEFLLKSSHYLVVCAGKGSLRNHSVSDMIVRKGWGTLCDIDELKPIPHQPSHLDDVCRRFGHAVAYDGESKLIYLLGGFGSRDNTHKRLSELIIIDTKTLETKTVSDHTLGRMFSSMTVSSSGKVYLSGGRTSPSVKGGFDDILELDSAGVVKDTGWRLPGGPLWRHSSVVLGDYLVIMGGVRAGKTEDCSDVMALNLNTGRWIHSEENLNIHSGSASVHEENGSSVIIYSGGLTNKEMVPSAKVYEIKIRDDNIIFGLGPNYDPRPVFSNTSHIINDQVFRIGGVCLDNNPPCQVDKFDAGAGHAFYLPVKVGDELLMSHNHASVVVGSELWILGGGGNCFSFGTHYNSFHKFNISSYI